MAEKCKSCGGKLSKNKKGHLCPTCGDYFCYDCSEDTNKSDAKEKEVPRCPNCNEFMKNIWPL